MPECVLTSRDEGWYQWADQFARARRTRFMVPFPATRGDSTLTQAQILSAYRDAARRAAGGKLIISAGHGGSSGLTGGMVDLAPDGALRLTSAHLTLHGQGRLQRQDQPVVQTAIAIGGILRQRRVNSVLFISCNVGNSLEFLGAIAGTWGGCTVGGYRRIVDAAWVEFTRGTRTYYIFLSNNAPTTDAEMRERSVNYPPLTPGNYWSTNRPVQALRPRRAGVPPPPRPPAERRR